MTVFSEIFTPLSRGKLLTGKFGVFLRIIGYIAAAVFPLYCYAVLEFIHFDYALKFMDFLKTRTAAVAFGVGVLYLFYLLLLLLFKKAFIASTLLGAATVILSMANYFKFAQVGDYLYPWDILQQAGNVGQLTGFLGIGFPYWAVILYMGLAVLTVITVIAKTELNLAPFLRICASLIIIMGIYINTGTPEACIRLLNKNSLYFENMVLQSSNYSTNGFVAAFSINVLSSGVSKPEGYSEEAVNDALSSYEDTKEGEGFKNPDIILILSESFWDPTLLPNVEFSTDPISNFREIASRDGAISGEFYTTGFGGGTVRPEFEVLTGLTTDYLPNGCVPYQYITENTSSYISEYKKLGYRTLAIHPYLSKFYLRKQAYPFIGIDELYFEDELYALKQVPYTVSGKQISDSSFVDYIKYYMSESTGDTFVFGISMENHQPYTNKFDRFDIDVKSDVIEEGVLSDLRNYTQGVYEADLALAKLVQWIDSREKETVLVYFGDHLPTLGANYAAYTQSGALALTGTTPEMNKFLYSTPFLIYSNFELEESEMVHNGTDNKLASYNLMNALATLIDAPRTKYMHFLEDYFHAYPAYNIRLWSVNKAPFEKFINAHKIITYDRIVGGKYSEK